jgi:hypothetical protein
MFMLCILAVFSFVPTLACSDIVGTVRVIDGDTIDVGTDRIRLHAIDAPEIDQTCETRNGNLFACGIWARTQVHERFQGRVATCDPLDVDRYGRIVAQCRVAGEDMGWVIVSEGWALAFRRYGMDYDLVEKATLITARGLHGVRMVTPAQHRMVRDKGLFPADPRCSIKGNISPNGKVFHVRGQHFYRRTRINEAQGERWFCSVSDAQKNGWRAARR